MIFSKTVRGLKIKRWDGFVDLWRCGRIRCMPPPGSACVMQECRMCFSIGTNGPSELPCTQREIT